MKIFRSLALIVVFFVLTSGCNAMNATKNPTVKIETSKGDLVLELYPDKAPKTVENFLAYVKDGFFEGTIFHRIIPNFMIQGGGFTEDMQEKPNKDPIENEADNGLKNEVGTLAMARTSDPHSATSQFFINVKDNDFLNFSGQTQQGWGYCVFGKITEGMDIVKAMEKVETGNSGMHQDVPKEAIKIIKVSIQE